MPNKDSHLDQVARNRGFWTGLRAAGGPVEWVVTGIFYEAVHLIEAALALQGIDSGKHHRQARRVEQDADLHVIADDLAYLKDESEDARYRGHKHTDQDLDDELIPALVRIRETVEKVLSR